jgi:hypothetical protein
MAQTQKQSQLYILAGLLLVAAAVWYFSFGGSKNQETGFAKGSEEYTPINAQDFSSVFDKVKSAQSTEYKSSGRNIFIASALPPPPDPNAPKPGPPPRQPQGPMLPPPPPPAQLPMKFFGYGNLPSGGPRRAFLLDGEEVHIVGEGEVVLNHIRITHIGNERIEFIDTITGQPGSNQLEFAVPAA